MITREQNSEFARRPQVDFGELIQVVDRASHDGCEAQDLAYRSWNSLLKWNRFADELIKACFNCQAKDS